MAVKIGDKVPDFTLQSNMGKSVQLKNLYHHNPLVLFFYPKDNSPGCTKEACGFRDSYQVFQEFGAEVVGVSADSVDSHQAFVTSYSLPFPLLSDVENKMRKQFGVPTTLGLLPGRVTYIIDTQGIVQGIYNSQLNFQGHIDEALKALKALK